MSLLDYTFMSFLSIEACSASISVLAVKMVSSGGGCKLVLLIMAVAGHMMNGYRYTWIHDRDRQRLVLLGIDLLSPGTAIAVSCTAVILETPGQNLAGIIILGHIILPNWINMPGAAADSLLAAAIHCCARLAARFGNRIVCACGWPRVVANFFAVVDVAAFW